MQNRVSAATSGAEMSELSEPGFRALARVLAKLWPALSGNPGHLLSSLINPARLCF